MSGRLLLSLLAWAGIIAAQGAPELHWEWASPLPHRQSWVDMAAGNGKFVGITDGYGGRSIYASANGTNWQSVAGPTNVILQRIVFAEGQFIAVGDRATIMTSTDGTDWILRRTDTAGWRLFDVAAGNGSTVAVGYAGLGFVSTDLKKWTQLEAFGRANSMVAVKYGSGKFVAIGQGGQLWISTDGQAWQSLLWPLGLPPVGLSDYAAGLEFNNGIFILSVGGITAASTDGVRWTLGAAVNMSRVVAAANCFLGLAGTTLYHTPNCSTWQPILNVEAPAGVRLTCAASLDGVTIVAGDEGRLYRSTDLSNWERVVKDVDYSHPKIAFGNGLFVRFGTAPGVEVSENGNEWQAIKEAPALRDLTFGNDLWVGIDTNGTAAISSTGKAWESVELPTAAGERIGFANGRFVAEATGGVLTSVDGYTWQYIALPGAVTVRLIGNAAGRWAVALDGQRPATSEDGLTWTVHPAQASLRGKVFAAGNGRFLGLGGAGMGFGFMIWSEDGVTWTERSSTTGTTFTEQSLTFADGTFLLTDSGGGVYTSVDGENWNGGRQAAQVFTGAAFANGEWLVAGGDSILRSTKPIQIRSVVQLKWRLADGQWSLALNGPPGTSYLIEGSSELGGEWNAVQHVNIPLSGEAILSTSVTGTNRFFRAAAVIPGAR